MYCCGNCNTWFVIAIWDHRAVRQCLDVIRNVTNVTNVTLAKKEPFRCTFQKTVQIMAVRPSDWVYPYGFACKHLLAPKHATITRFSRISIPMDEGNDGLHFKTCLVHELPTDAQQAVHSNRASQPPLFAQLGCLQRLRRPERRVGPLGQGSPQRFVSKAPMFWLKSLQDLTT